MAKTAAEAIREIHVHGDASKCPCPICRTWVTAKTECDKLGLGPEQLFVAVCSVAMHVITTAMNKTPEESRPSQVFQMKAMLDRLAPTTKKAN